MDTSTLLLCLVGLVVAGWTVSRLARLGKRLEARTVSALDAWAAQTLVELLGNTPPFPRGEWTAALRGESASPAFAQWASQHRVSAELSITRQGHRVDAKLRVAFDQGRRTVSRSLDWSELPESVRGRFLAGEHDLKLPWQAPWSAAGMV